MSLGMMYPRWQEFLEGAILEFDPPKLRVKLDSAEQVISERFNELSSDVELTNRQELVALAKAFIIVRILEKNRIPRGMIQPIPPDLGAE